MSKLTSLADLPFEKVKNVINLCGTLLLAWIFAGVIGTALAAYVLPSGEEASGQQNIRRSARGVDGLGSFSRKTGDYSTIVNRNIFDSQNRIIEEEKKAASKSPIKSEPVVNLGGPPVLSNINAKLVGTVVSTSPSLSFATIVAGAGKKGSENLFIGEKILGEARITEIERNRVYFIRNNRKEYLEIKDKGVTKVGGFDPAPTARLGRDNSVREVSPGKYVVDRSRVEAVMANLSEVMTQARVVPHFSQGKPAGWKIFAIKPNSIYKELKLRNGDVIQRINGVDIDSPAKALEMYQQLAAESNINIDLIRRGKKQTFEYSIR